MNQRGNGQMGRFSVEFAIANYQDVLHAQDGTLAADQVRQVQLRGVVDYGAARLVLPERVVDQLGLPSAGVAKVRYTDQREADRRRVKDVWLQLQGREGVFTAVVEPARTDALIGAIVLEELDFIVDCTTQQLHPRDPHYIVSEIE